MMTDRTINSKIIVAETYTQIEAEEVKSIWIRNLKLLAKLEDYLIAKIDELAGAGEEACYGIDLEPVIVREMEDRRLERLRKINNRKRGIERAGFKTVEREKAAAAKRILDRFKKKKGDW